MSIFDKAKVIIDEEEYLELKKIKEDKQELDVEILLDILSEGFNNLTKLSFRPVKENFIDAIKEKAKEKGYKFLVERGLSNMRWTFKKME